MPDLSGQDIGRYHIIEQLGEGGMATVYKAFDTRLERDVAIKVIRKDAFSANMHATIFKRFEREAKALARLSHPNIVKIYDYGEYDGSPYLVMEYIPGGTLKSKMGEPFKVGDAVRLLLPIANALEYAHEHDIIHRDVKPANILLSEKNQPVLSDFGIAKMLEGEEGATLTGTGVGIGTPEYMAPEQCLGETVDKRTDIYALGIVFYELVAGRKPFMANTPMAVVHKQISDPLPRPAQFAPGLPDGVEKVIFKALAKVPDERYISMAEFSAALERLSSSVSSQSQVQPNPFASANEPPQTLRKDAIYDRSLPVVEQTLPPQKKQDRSNRNLLIGLAGGVGIILVGGVLLALLAGGIWLSGKITGSKPTITRTVSIVSTSTPIPIATMTQAPTLPPTTTVTAAPTETSIVEVTTVPSTASPGAAVFKVTTADLTVNPPLYIGSCATHVKFTFKGTITTNGAGTVVYHFVRSDGAQGPVYSLVFTSGSSQTVTTDWSLGHSYTGEEQISIDSPNQTTSKEAFFTLTCAP
jgi:serine/threonine protein kinase